MSEANLNGANLEGAELDDSFLHGADLTDVINLTCDQLDLAMAYARLHQETGFDAWLHLSTIGTR